MKNFTLCVFNQNFLKRKKLLSKSSDVKSSWHGWRDVPPACYSLFPAAHSYDGSELRVLGSSKPAEPSLLIIYWEHKVCLCKDQKSAGEPYLVVPSQILDLVCPLLCLLAEAMADQRKVGLAESKMSFSLVLSPRPIFVVWHIIQELWT